MHDSRFSFNGNAGLFEFGSEHAPADVTTLSSDGGRGAAGDSRGSSRFMPEVDALDGFASETSGRRDGAGSHLAPLPAAVTDVRRTGCASSTSAGLSVEDIRAQLLRRAMHIVSLFLLVVMAMLFGAGAMLLAMRELAPATPVTTGVVQQQQQQQQRHR